MKSAGSQQVVYATGFPSLVEELKRPSEMRSGLVRGLHALLRAAEMRITYEEVDVLTGQAMQFHYSRAHPECSELSFVPPVDTLFRSLGITWKEVTPSGPRTAFQVLRQWIDDGHIALARLKIPLLVYGYTDNTLEMKLFAARLNGGLHEELLSITECDKQYWRYPFDEGNLLIQVEGAPKTAPDLLKLTKWAAHRSAASWHAGEIAGCPTGEEAYASLSADLRSGAFDLNSERAAQWLSGELWLRWSARRSLHAFFDRMASRFGGEARAACAKASFSYEQCAAAWKRFGEATSATARAQAVDEAAEWEGKAVALLVKLIG